MSLLISFRGPRRRQILLPAKVDQSPVDAGHSTRQKEYMEAGFSEYYAKMKADQDRAREHMRRMGEETRAAMPLSRAERVLPPSLLPSPPKDLALVVVACLPGLPTGESQPSAGGPSAFHRVPLTNLEHQWLDLYCGCQASRLQGSQGELRALDCPALSAVSPRRDSLATGVPFDEFAPVDRVAIASPGTPQRYEGLAPSFVLAPVRP